MTGVMYKNATLEHYVCFLGRNKISLDLILLGENAEPHKYYYVRNYLESEDIRGLYWQIITLDRNWLQHEGLLKLAIPFAEHTRPGKFFAEYMMSVYDRNL